MRRMYDNVVLVISAVTLITTSLHLFLDYRIKCKTLEVEKKKLECERKKLEAITSEESSESQGKKILCREVRP